MRRHTQTVEKALVDHLAHAGDDVVWEDRVVTPAGMPVKLDPEASLSQQQPTTNEKMLCWR